MADINFDGTNLLGAPFKEYVNDQIGERQTRLGKLDKSSEEIVWENGKSAYIALASSVNISNTSTAFFDNNNSTVTRNLFATSPLDSSFPGLSNAGAVAGNVLFQEEIEYPNPNSEGIKKIKSLGLEGDPNQYLSNYLANNVVLFGGTSYYEIDSSGSYSNPYYRSGVSTKNSILNKSAYGFGGNSFGLTAMPGIVSFNLKSRNMGSLREATITLRANSDDQFKLIDTLYCRIGYTMFFEWGNSIYFDNNSKYISNPPSEGVTSLIPMFLSKNTKGSKMPGNTILENPSEFIQLIEERRKKSNGNYDGFFGKIKNFKWQFNKNGYYEITLSLISQGDIIESLKIDGLYGGETQLTGSIVDIPVDNNSSLTTFISLVAEPDEFTNTVGVPRGSVFTSIYRKNFKTQLLPTSSFSTSVGSSVLVSGSTSTSSDTIPELEYTRVSSSIGKICSGTAIFNDKTFYYIRLGDILDFINDRLLIYNSIGNNENILYIDSQTDTNLMYCPGVNVSADPTKVMVRTSLPYNTAGLLRLSQFSGTVNQQTIFSLPGDAELESWLSRVDPNDPTNTDFPLHGKIMNIYFEYQYLMDTIKNLRDEETGRINLFDFLDALCKTANSCLGGINKLSVRLEKDFIVRIYDQTPIYGTQIIPAQNSNTINLYGINPEGSNQGSFVTDFDIKTELTNDFATLISIGAQAQGSTVTEDSTGISTWNKGLIDRWFPGKIDSLRKDNNSRSLTVKELLDRTTNQLKSLWLGYAKGKLDDIVTGSSGIPALKDAYIFKGFPIDKVEAFVKLQKDWLHQLIIYENQLLNTQRLSEGKEELGTNQVGMIPMNISITMDGLSGIRIYDRLQLDTRFLPSYYPRTLVWIIKGVSHEIVNNKWFTKLETIAYPKLPEKQQLYQLLNPSVTSTSGSANVYPYTGPSPNADLIRAFLPTVGVTEKFKHSSVGELSSGGDVTLNLVNLTKAVLSEVERQIRLDSTLSNLWDTTRVEITAGNDDFHQLNGGSATSRHKVGNAIDLVVVNPTLRAATDKILSGIALGTANVSYINEYDFPDPQGNSLSINNHHFHISFGSAVGAAAFELIRANRRFRAGEIGKITLTF